MDMDEARREVARLVEAFEAQALEVTNSVHGYTETETRGDFIDPLLQALGWDVHNRSGCRQAERDVVLERTGADDGSAIGRPDYRLRYGGRDWMPVEAKKPSTRLTTNPTAAKQARTYGWSLSLPASVLTNFAELMIFDATVEVQDDDGVSVALIPGCHFTYQDFVLKFDELWKRLSYASLAGDGLSVVYSYTQPPRGESPFDRSFLDHFRRWRLLLASDIARNNRTLGAPEVGRRTQRLLNALLFLRVCEDRNIGRYEGLIMSASANTLLQTFRDADLVFNAGMFDVLSSTVVSPTAITAVVREMYWPRSKFAYGVLRPDILAGVYEQYLAERVEIATPGSIHLVQKPELTHAGGVVPTPGWVVDKLLRSSLGTKLSDSQAVPFNLTVLDPACGSGIFLVAALEMLAATAESGGEPNNLSTRGRLAQQHLFGVDIDGEAVEVTKLSLLLAVLGDEVVDTRASRGLLPDLSNNIRTGNSLVGNDFDTLMPAVAAIPERRAAATPFDFQDAFAPPAGSATFSVIVGNPPYARIQTMAQYLPDQLAYFRDSRSGYHSAQGHNFDMYMLFVERSLRLLTPDGRLAFIVPHRFTSGPAGIPMRELIGPRLTRMVHFGEEQVFQGRTTYTCLLELGEPGKRPAVLELAHSLREWLRGETCPTNEVERAYLGAEPWPIASTAAAAVFSCMDRAAVARLGDPEWVDIFVGVQTSADNVFFVKPDSFESTRDLMAFRDRDGNEWEVEHAILRKAIRDQSILAYQLDPPPDSFVFFPYSILPPTGTSTRSRAVLHSPAEMARRYPKALAYFMAHKDELRARNVSPDPGEAFWAYGRSQSLTKLSDPKVIVRVLSLTPRYAIDTRGLVAPSGGDGGPYYLLRPKPGCSLSIPVLVALLSHPAIDAYVASRGRAYRGSYVVHRKAFLAEVPVPKLSTAEVGQIEKSVAELHQLMGRLENETDTAFRTTIAERIEVVKETIETLITTAFGITEEEVARASG